MTSNIPWEWYRSFLEVARTGSLSAAARALGMTQPTVGRHIAGLESQLQQSLFVRTAAGLQPTAHALALQPYAQSLESTVHALQRAAHQHTQHVAGAVRISASEVLAAEVLPALLVPLAHAHPQLHIEIVSTDTVQDMLRRDADIAVRMVRPTQSQLIAQHLGRVELGLYGHTRYLSAYGCPHTLEALHSGQHRLIGFDTTTPFIRQMQQHWPHLMREQLGFRTDSSSVSLALLRAGAGLGLCHTALAAQDAALQRVLPAELALHLEMWLVMHEDLRHHPGCHAVFQALSAGLQDYAARGYSSASPCASR